MESHSLLVFIQQIFLTVFYDPGTVLGGGHTIRCIPGPQRLIFFFLKRYPPNLYSVSDLAFRGVGHNFSPWRPETTGKNADDRAPFLLHS